MRVCVFSFPVMVQSYGHMSSYVVLYVTYVTIKAVFCFSWHLLHFSCSCDAGHWSSCLVCAPGVFFFDLPSVFARIPLLETVSNKIVTD